MYFTLILKYVKYLNDYKNLFYIHVCILKLLSRARQKHSLSSLVKVFSLHEHQREIISFLQIKQKLTEKEVREFGKILGTYKSSNDIKTFCKDLHQLYGEERKMLIPGKRDSLTNKHLAWEVFIFFILIQSHQSMQNFCLLNWWTSDVVISLLNIFLFYISVYFAWHGNLFKIPFNCDFIFKVMCTSGNNLVIVLLQGWGHTFQRGTSRTLTGSWRATTCRQCSFCRLQGGHRARRLHRRLDPEILDPTVIPR